jgi:hypothetical protein
MPEKTVKRRLQDCDAALASDDGPIFSAVAKLVEVQARPNGPTGCSKSLARTYA